jgi:hypothetical protein
MRETLIDAILDLSGDEYESRQDVIELARESEPELIDRIIAIACFYRDQFNDVVTN